VRFVLAHSPLNVAGDPDIEHPALTTHDVHVVCLFHTNILGANGRGCLCRASHLQLWISRFEPTPFLPKLDCHPEPAIRRNAVERSYDACKGPRKPSGWPPLLA
jgi:hypothetical protein